MSKTISARIDETLHNKLRDVCNNEGITVNDKLKQILDKNLNQTINNTDDIENRQENKTEKEESIKIQDSSKTNKPNDTTKKILEELLENIDNKIKKQKEEKTNLQSEIKIKKIPSHNKSGIHCCIAEKCSNPKLNSHTFSSN